MNKLPIWQKFVFLLGLTTIGCIALGGQAGAQAVPGDPTTALPSLTNNYLIVSNANAPGTYYSPVSANYLYVPTTQAQASITLTSEIAAAGGVNSMAIGVTPSCAPTTGTNFILNPNVGSTITVSNSQATGTITNGVVTYRVYCVQVTTVSTSNVFFELRTNIPGAYLGTYPGASSSLGTGYAGPTAPSQTYNANAEWDQLVSFSPPCGVTSAPYIELYDLDMYNTSSGVPMNPNLNVRLRRVHKATGASVYLALEGNVTQISTAVYRPVTNSSLGDSNGDNVIDSTYGTTNQRPLWRVRIAGGTPFNDDYKYVLEVNDVRNVNLIRINLPYDQINSIINCPPTVVDRVPTLTAQFDCDARRWVFVTDDADDPGPSDYVIQHVYRQYNYATATWGPWTPVIATSPFYQYSNIAHTAGWADNVRLWNGGGAGYVAAHDFVYRQYRFRTQGRDGDGGTAPAYVYSTPDFPLMGRCVQATCAVSIPATTTWNTPFTATFTIRNIGVNDGRTWTQADNMDLENSAGAVVANLVNGSPNGAPVVRGDAWIFSISVPNPTVGANRSFSWNFVRGATTIATCTDTTNVRYAPPVVLCTLPSIAFVEQGSTDNTLIMNASYSGANAASTGEIRAASVATTGYSDTTPDTPPLPDPVPISTNQPLTFNNFRYPIATGTVNVNGSVTIWTIDGIGGPGFTVTDTCTEDAIVGNWSYLRSYGGDIWTGAQYSTTGSCSSTTGTIDTFAEETATGSGQYRGSSAQFSVTSLLNVATGGFSRGFFSANNRHGAPETTPPRGLTRANNVAAQRYGGGYGFAQCMTDYYGTTSGVANPATLPLYTAPIFPNQGIVRRRLPANSTIATGNLIVPIGTQMAIYVDGDLYINGNIVNVTAAPPAALDQIPFLALIVRGNIFIDNDVRRLDGLYIAQVTPTNTKGKIFTCSPGLNAVYTAAQLFANCGGNAAGGVSGQLVFNGAVVADRIHFLRTFGSLRQSVFNDLPVDFTSGAGTAAAEVFNYTPEMYLAPSPLVRTNSTGNTTGVGQYDAITSMPPAY